MQAPCGEERVRQPDDVVLHFQLHDPRIRNRAKPIMGAGQLAANRRRGIGIVAKVGRLEDRFSAPR
jgi:hypothetical protein